MRLLDGVIRALVLVGQLALVGLVGLTVVGVVFRYGLNDPIFGLNDVSRMTLLVAVACSLAYGGRQGAHVAVDLLGV
ncbi:MAG TPA: TRAP transporter small permease subunit, partial [Hyphomicrobiales bacterium]|nr:TRAP transporter small permease subunit [Hyphomicrobiales bacterium]